VNRTDHKTYSLSSVPLYIAAIDMAWSLLQSSRGQEALYLFQKRLLCWEYINSFSNCRCLQYMLGGESVDPPLLLACIFFPSHQTASSLVTTANGQLVFTLCYQKDQQLQSIQSNFFFA